MRGVVVFLIGTIGAVAIAVGSSAFADSLKSVVRTLNAIVNPGMLGRLEDQARLYHRANEERYWLNYGAQLIPSSSLRRPGNGDLGIVSRLDTEESQLTVQFDGRDITYDFAALDELVLAYATTIHKSQGAQRS